MSKTLIIAVGGVVVGIVAALGIFLFVFGGGSTPSEAAAVPTPVHVAGKLGPRITLQDRIFNLQGGPGAQAYLKVQTVIEFETTSEDWAMVLNGCVATLRPASEPLVAAVPRMPVGVTLDLEGAAVDPCVAAEEELLEEFAREIGTGRDLIEDAVLTVVSRHTAAELSTPAGKDALKVEIKEAIEELIPEPEVTRVLFTNFITQ